MQHGDLFLASWWHRQYQACRFRFDPVPHTGGRHNFRAYRRQCNCLQEKRVYEEHKRYVRMKRSPGYLPDTWDNKPRADWRDRSWKGNRKVRKQWMR